MLLNRAEHILVVCKHLQGAVSVTCMDKECVRGPETTLFFTKLLEMYNSNCPLGNDGSQWQARNTCC